MDADSALAFIQQFEVLSDPTDNINCIEVSKLLYAAHLTKFKIELSVESNDILLIYQNKVYNMVENMRNMTPEELKSVFKILDDQNPSLADIVIMSWSLPRVNECLSQLGYDNKYKSNIKKYNKLLVDIVDFYVIRNFCIETLDKNNNVPIHCIDILWYYMNGLSIDFSFNSDANKRYIEIKFDEEDTEYILFGFHLEYLLDIGLGQNMSETDPFKKGSFRIFLKSFVSNPELVKSFVTSMEPSSKNYIKQLKLIASDSTKYFGTDVACINV